MITCTSICTQRRNQRETQVTCRTYLLSAESRLMTRDCVFTADFSFPACDGEQQKKGFFQTEEHICFGRCNLLITLNEMIHLAGGNVICCFMVFIQIQ